MDGAKVLRDSVDGKVKYCRLPIRRRRTPMYSYELEELLWTYMTETGVDTERIKCDATSLFKQEAYEDAGLLCSLLDFIEVIGRISVAPNGMGVSGDG